MDIRAPYKFLAVNKDAAIEFRVMYEAEAIFDAATGAFAARVDTSRDKKTGVRMVRGMVSGHGQFGLAIYANLGVGVCVASVESAYGAELSGVHLKGLAFQDELRFVAKAQRQGKQPHRVG